MKKSYDEFKKIVKKEFTKDEIEGFGKTDNGYGVYVIAYGENEIEIMCDDLRQYGFECKRWHSSDPEDDEPIYFIEAIPIINESADDINNTAYFDRVAGELHSWYVCYVEDYERKYEYGFKNEKECINWIKKNGFDLDPSMIESKKSARTSLKESADDILTVKEFCFWGHSGNIVEIWTIDGVLCDTFEVRNVGKSEYKNYEIHGWDCAKNTVIIYIKK